MPKIPRAEWSQFTDPESIEHTPTRGEIDQQEELADQAFGELSDIEYALRYGEQDPYTGEVSEFTNVSPEDLLNQLERLQQEVISKITDPEFKRSVKQKLEATRELVYKQFIPFIRSLVYSFGWSHSPLEQHPGHGVDAHHISPYFTQAKATLDNLKLTEDDRLDFLTEIAHLEEQFANYQHEPTLFTFERIEQELYDEVSKNQLRRFPSQVEVAGVIDHPEARNANTIQLDLLINYAHQLTEIADRMLVKTISDSCKDRAKYALNFTMRLKMEFDAPKEMRATEAELKDLIHRMQRGEQIGEEIITSFAQRIAEMEKRYPTIDQSLIKQLEILLERVNKLSRGEIIDEDDERFALAGSESENFDWAWDILGVQKGASTKEARRAYRKLAKKYHPDHNKNPDAPAKMTRLADAMEFIEKQRRFEIPEI